MISSDYFTYCITMNIPVRIQYSYPDYKLNLNIEVISCSTWNMKFDIGPKFAKRLKMD